ncbi:MAG: hypothetical protein JKY34_09225 [Kordiimonadaceae bacterium]|nr:hypothetical protein [Kordiimonadaceae bacterium]
MNRFEIVPATFRDLTYIAANMRAGDVAELSCLHENWHPQTVAHNAHCQSFEDSQFVALEDGQPVVGFGACPFSGTDPDLWQAWAFGTQRMRRAVPAITRFLRDSFMPDVIEKTTVRRVQCFTLSTHDISHKWLSGLGANCEGHMKSFGRNGEDFDIYAWTR